LTLATAEFGLPELVESVAETLAPQAHRKGLELSAQIAEDVPAIAVGDSGRIRQILMNLVGNAIKFTTAGEATILAEREPHTPGMIRFSVIDTGPGIDPADHARIFASYAQAAARVAGSIGSGLGLAIVKQLAELMGGRVWLESMPGRGSSFHCSVRIGYQPLANLGVNYRHGQILAGRRLLVIGGSQHSGAALAAALAVHGAELKLVSDPDEAAAAASLAPEWPDAILADWPANASDHAPVLNSIKAALPNGLPLIALLPATDRSARMASLRSIGVDHYVIKPPRQAELIAEVIAAMEPAREAARTSAVPFTQAEGGTPPAVTGLRILLADDAEDNRVLIEAFLRHSGCHLDLASSGAEAVKHFMARRYDVILMDLHMPEMNGYEAIRQIRAWERTKKLVRTPIIALTAAVLEDSVRESLEAGCDSHVSKPVKRSTLFNALREATSAGRQTART
jgi:two-component system sensor histidine kinase/response regulator